MIKEYIIKIDKDQSKKDIYGGYPLIEPPLELIRCKDCRFGMWTKNFLGEDRIACVKEESFVQEDRALPPEWFCADGKRAKEEA